MLCPMGQGLSSLLTSDHHRWLLLCLFRLTAQALPVVAVQVPSGTLMAIFTEALSLADPPKFRHAAIQGNGSLTCVLRMGPCPAFPGCTVALPFAPRCPFLPT